MRKCTRCGREVDDNSPYKWCEICRENSRRERQCYKQHNVCYACRKNTSIGNGGLCHECKAKGAEWAIKYYHRNIEKCRENKRKRYKELHSLRLENGVCSICGRETSGGYKTCARYRTKNRENKAKHYIPTPKIEKPQGICCVGNCNNPVRKNCYKVCEEHFQSIYANRKREGEVVNDE